jgi:hypothetical protein
MTGVFVPTGLIGIPNRAISNFPVLMRPETPELQFQRYGLLTQLNTLDEPSSNDVFHWITDSASPTPTDKKLYREILERPSLRRICDELFYVTPRNLQSGSITH